MTSFLHILPSCQLHPSSSSRPLLTLRSLVRSRATFNRPTFTFTFTFTFSATLPLFEFRIPNSEFSAPLHLHPTTPNLAEESSIAENIDGSSLGRWQPAVRTGPVRGRLPESQATGVPEGLRLADISKRSLRHGGRTRRKNLRTR